MCVCGGVEGQSVLMVAMPLPLVNFNLTGGLKVCFGGLQGKVKLKWLREG